MVFVRMCSMLTQSKDTFLHELLRESPGQILVNILACIWLALKQLALKQKDSENIVTSHNENKVVYPLQCMQREQKYTNLLYH